MEKVFQLFQAWRRDLIAESGPRIVFISTEGKHDPSSLILPFLAASFGITVPALLVHPAPLWSRLSRQTGMNLKLASGEFSRQLKLNQTAITFLPEDRGQTGDRMSDNSYGISLSILQTVFFILGFSSPQYAVFDIKIGRENHLKSPDQGLALASRLRDLCERLQVESLSILSDFHQPIGRSLGNFLTIRESLNLFDGIGPLDLLKLILELGAAGLRMVLPQKHPAEIKSRLKNALLAGKVRTKARDTVVQQGGSPEAFDTFEQALPGNLSKHIITSPESGYIQAISWDKSLDFQRKLEGLHPDSGIVFQKKAGDSIASGECLATIYLPGGHIDINLRTGFLDIFTISKTSVPYRPLVLGRFS